MAQRQARPQLSAPTADSAQPQKEPGDEMVKCGGMQPAAAAKSQAERQQEQSEPSAPAAGDGAAALAAEQHRLMGLALEQARLALHADEVPVGCVFVERSSGRVLAAAHNQTNKSCNATRHCEIEAIDQLLLEQKQDPSILASCDLYVTCEPCVMCASALRLIRIGRVFYGCANNRFGGNGSVLPLHLPETKGFPGTPGYPSVGGIRPEEAITLFRAFYERGNPSAPAAKRHRPLKLKEEEKDYPSLSDFSSFSSSSSSSSSSPSASQAAVSLPQLTIRILFLVFVCFPVA
eukprot:g1674.t1